uniref:AP2/ERF domain-containing protein n=1 Tax=Oryza glumipatula TaxID=40148 RepID=A0A0E0B5H0_9ORYZ
MEVEEAAYRTVWSEPPKRPAGRTKFRETRHPVYRGVRRRGGRPGAAGRAACLNFADSAWRMPPVPASAALAGARGVRDAVAVAVEAFQRQSAAPSSPAETFADDGNEEEDNKDVLPVAAAEVFDAGAFELDDGFRFGGMDAGSYYASLAQGLLVEPPAAGAWWEDGELAGSDMPLWSY